MLIALAEIKDLIKAWYNNELSRVEKKEILQGKIKEVDIKIKQLKEVRKHILKLMDDVEKGLC